MRDRLIELFDSWGLSQFMPFHTEREMLAYYLIDNGVVCPPVKVGDIVYLFYPVRKGIYEAVVDEISLSRTSNFIVTRDLYFNRRQAIFFEQFGKTVFLSKEEAEKALRGEGE